MLAPSAALLPGTAPRLPSLRDLTTTGTNLLKADTERRAAPPAAVAHGQILANLLKQVAPVDFRKLAGLQGDHDKLNNGHYVVIVVQQVLSMAARANLGLCRRQGFLYSYNGAFWKRLEEPEIRQFLRDVAEGLGVPSMIAQFVNFSDLLYRQFLDMSTVSAPPTPDRVAVLVNLQNGTFEIDDDATKLRPPAAADFLTHQLPFAYDPAATCPMWQTFLDRAVPDRELQRVLAEYMGYVFIPSAKLKLEKVLLLYGTGANGKSVFFEVIRQLLGAENMSSYSLGSLTTEPGYARALLGSKLVNYASELSGKMGVDAFKALSSGEPIEARLPYGQPFMLTDYAKLIFNCNELPAEVEHTHAYFRRWLIAPFVVTIPDKEQDKTLASRIVGRELAGVFNWVLAGLERVLAQQGFSACEAAQQQLDVYKQQSDSVKLFLNEYGYSPSATNCIPTADVYRQYKDFCVDDGYRAVARGKFVARLRTAGIEETRRNTGKALAMSANPPL